MYVKSAEASGIYEESAGRYGIWAAGNLAAGYFGDNVTVTGTLTESSDRAAKHDIAAVDAAQVSSNSSMSRLHLGVQARPRSQAHWPDGTGFYAAFRLGTNDTSISAIDHDGVALAAIQELTNSCKPNKRKKIEALKAQLGNMMARP